ncbi:MAG: peptide ABC transporter substrate-binding protein, partial [Verrucomicrobiota bacterium]
AGSVKVVKNEHYWDKDSVKLNGIEFYPFENNYTEERAFRNGLIHKTYVVPPNLIPRYKKAEDPRLKLEPYIGSYFYRFNQEDPVTKNIHLRRALSCAIDREKIVRFVTQAGEKPAYAFTPPTEGGYQPPEMIFFDPEAAKAHLKKAGYESGADVPEFTLMINTSEAHKAVAVAIQDMWKQHLGIDKVNIVNQEWKVYQVTIQNLEYQAARSGWIGDYLDPKTFLSLMTSWDTNNHTGWKNDDYDRLFNESEQIGDPEQRYAKLREAEEVLLNDLPVVPIYWYTTKYLISPHVEGWQPLLLDNHPFKYVDLKEVD